MKARTLVKQASKKKKVVNNVQQTSIEATVPYRFKPGICPNPLGRGAGDPLGYMRELSVKVMRSSPPKEILDRLNLDHSATWAEAILFALAKAATDPDVSAAREMLAFFGVTGTTAKNFMAVQINPETSGLANEFLRHSHGLSDEQLAGIYVAMDELPRAPLVVDASFFPSEQDETKRLETGNGKV